MIRKRALVRSEVFFISVLAIVLIGAALMSASLSAPARALPPRPTAEPTVEPTVEPTAEPTPRSPTAKDVETGGYIELRAQFPADWPWHESPWQDMWTVVQWQDAGGDWLEVEGWQGGLDDVSLTPAVDGGISVVGEKVWWVAKPQMGKGPFRWAVYGSAGDELLATSDDFNLPAAPHEIKSVELRIANVE
jgi:hypothetical protein